MKFKHSRCTGFKVGIFRIRTIQCNLSTKPTFGINIFKKYNDYTHMTCTQNIGSERKHQLICSSDICITTWQYINFWMENKLTVVGRWLFRAVYFSANIFLQGN